MDDAFLNDPKIPPGALVFTLVTAGPKPALMRLSTIVHRRWAHAHLSPITVDDLIAAVGDEHPIWMTYWTDMFSIQPSAFIEVEDDLTDHLWTAVEEGNEETLQAFIRLMQSGPTLKDLLNDPRWKLRQRHSSAIIHAVAIAALHDRALDDVLLFATFLAQADQPTKADAALLTLETLARQSGVDVAPKGMDDSIPSLLKLTGRGITTLRISGSEPLSAAMENASPDATAVILHVLEEAEAIRTKTGKDDRLDNRHFIAALLARTVAPYLDEQNFDVPSLRRALLNFIVDEHGESADAWRSALFVSSPFEMANRIASDVWTYDDALGYRVYAKAIADAILKGSTTPPLTIGIQAPWGHGKTSLMRMVQAYLDPDSRTRNDDPPRAAAVTSKYREFLRLLGTPDLFLRAKAWLASKLGREAESTTVVERDSLIPDRPGSIPTVWFNPLYYRERKQIWAGLVQNRKAFFFLGMDMAMVASALEQMHKKSDGFGWRFMEKFVQLPFVIPHLDPETAKKFAMEQLRGTAAAPEPPLEATTEALRVDLIAERVKRAATPSEVGHIAKVALAAPISAADRARLEETFSSRTTELMADPDSDEIESIAKLAVEDLELNPRTIKRYFCLVRVLRNIQIATGAARSPESDRKAILRTAHLLMNWPEFAQWLRDVPQVATGDTWSDSYSEIDGAATKAKTMSVYEESLKKLFGDAAPECVADASLYRFLNKIGNDGPSLTDIYSARLL